MKKFLFVLFLFLFTGCSSSNNDYRVDNYLDYIDKLDNIIKSSDISFPFDINIEYEKVSDNEVRYQVIIDNPKEDIKNISAIVVHDKSTKDMFPTSGIFEKKLNLLCDKIDKEKGNVKGIILVGYIKFEGDIKDFKPKFKVLINFDNNYENKTIYFIK